MTGQGYQTSRYLRQCRSRVPACAPPWSAPKVATRSWRCRTRRRAPASCCSEWSRAGCAARTRRPGRRCRQGRSWATSSAARWWRSARASTAGRRAIGPRCCPSCPAVRATGAGPVRSRTARHARYVGLGGAPGGLAELTVVTPLAAFPFPADLEPRLAALVEPFAVGLHTVHAAGLDRRRRRARDRRRHRRPHRHRVGAGQRRRSHHRGRPHAGAPWCGTDLRRRRHRRLDRRCGARRLRRRHRVRRQARPPRGGGHRRPPRRPHRGRRRVHGAGAGPVARRPDEGAHDPVGRLLHA